LIAPKKPVHRGTGTQRQELRRHKKLDILMIDDDNRGLDQQDISQMLDGMF